MIIVPTYITEAVNRWLDELSEKLDSPMSKKERDYNQESLINYGLKFNKLPSIDETIKQINQSKLLSISDGEILK